MLTPVSQIHQIRCFRVHTQYVREARQCFTIRQCHVVTVTSDEISSGNWIYWALTYYPNNKQLRQFHWVAPTKGYCNYSTYEVCSVFTSRCLVAASNDGRSSSSEFPNRSRPQLPASQFSQLQLSTKLSLSSGASSPGSHCGSSVSGLGQAMWDLWRTKRHWAGFPC
jgi:hypothetical protein